MHIHKAARSGRIRLERELSIGCECRCVTEDNCRSLHFGRDDRRLRLFVNVPHGLKLGGFCGFVARLKSCPFTTPPEAGLLRLAAQSRALSQSCSKRVDLFRLCGRLKSCPFTKHTRVAGCDSYGPAVGEAKTKRHFDRRVVAIAPRQFEGHPREKRWLRKKTRSRSMVNLCCMHQEWMT